MARKAEKPFNTIMQTRSILEMYVKYGDAALQDKTPQEFAAETLAAFDHLMTFRNIINGMVSFDEEPEDAALFYISHDKIKAAAEA